MKAAAKRAKIPVPRERDVQRACLALLQVNGLLCWRNNSARFRATYKGKQRSFRCGGLPGASDLMAILPGGKFLACEIKRPGATPTTDQIVFLRAVNDQGGMGIWVDSAAVLERLLPYLLAGARVKVDDEGELTIYPAGMGGGA